MISWQSPPEEEEETGPGAGAVSSVGVRSMSGWAGAGLKAGLLVSVDDAVVRGEGEETVGSLVGEVGRVGLDGDEAVWPGAHQGADLRDLGGDGTGGVRPAESLDLLLALAQLSPQQLPLLVLLLEDGQEVGEVVVHAGRDLDQLAAPGTQQGVPGRGRGGGEEVFLRHLQVG